MTYREDAMIVDGQRWELGVIESAKITADPCLSFWLMFKFRGCGQGFGGYALDDWSKDDNRRIGHAAGSDALIQIMRAMGVDEWSKLSGKLAWAIRDGSGGLGSTIVGIARPIVHCNDRNEGVFLISEWRAKWFPKLAVEVEHGDA